ncbi:MAG TPA: glycosyltransferase family 4 protein [Elusimicrobiales bacterium]|nr:glycosyltransferase family 4 protein [Elusimicrobiales bacterium]
MNILFVSESKNLSGGTNQMLLTAKKLSLKGHKIFFAISSKGALYKRAKEKGFTVDDVEIKQDYDVLSALKIKKICKKRKIDLMHAHHPQAHAVCLVAKYLGLKIPFIVTRRVIFRIRTNFFSKIKYHSKKITHFIAVCNATKNELIKGGVNADKISVIPSAVDFSKYEQARQKRLHLEFKPPFRIGLVGHYGWVKGQDYIMEAAPSILKEFPDTTFVFAGRDTEKLRPKADSLGIADKVEILGERKDVPDILSGLHLFIMPSLQEGIATALIEAQSAQVPAVASNIGGIPDVLIDGETGILVPSKNPEALSAAILKMLKNPQTANEMAQKGYIRVLENFTLKKVALRLESLYKEIISQEN